jgi:hypothetical protein
MSAPKHKRVVEGCKLPSAGPATDNERAWVEFLRIIYNDAVPAPNYDHIVLLRRLESELHSSVNRSRE